MVVPVWLFFSPNNSVPSQEYFTNTPPQKLFFHFKSGGNLNYNSAEIKNPVLVDDSNGLDLILEQFKLLEYDYYAPHRGKVDYSVYINFEVYEKSKFNIKMSRIDDDYVFFFKKGKFRNKTLAEEIIRMLNISYTESDKDTASSSH